LCKYAIKKTIYAIKVEWMGIGTQTNAYKYIHCISNSL